MKKRIAHRLMGPAFLMFLAGCSYSEPQTGVAIENISRKPDSYVFATVFTINKYRQPTGFINTFPNGGVLKLLEESVFIYLCNAQTGAVKLLAEIKAPFMGMKRLRPWLQGWDDDAFYFSLTSGQSWDSDYRNLYFRMGQDGKFDEVQSEAVAKLPGESLARMRGEKNYLRLSIDHTSYTIVAKTEDDGGYRPVFVVDKVNRKLVPAARGIASSLRSSQ